MLTITFSRIARGDYTISDNNNSRLLCIGSILVDPVLRKEVKKIVSYASELGVGPAQQIETDLYSLSIRQPDEVTLFLNLDEKKGEQLSYQTDIPLEELTSLIEGYEEALDDDRRTITITCIQDTFELTSSD